MGNDYRVVVSTGDARHRFLAIPCRKAILARHEDIGLRVEHQERRTPLVNEVIGNNNHGLCGKAKPSHLHRGGGDFPGFSSAHRVRQKRAVALQLAPHRILLVLIEVSFAQDMLVHSGEGEVRAVEGSQADIVERVVVVAGQSALSDFHLNCRLVVASGTHCSIGPKHAQSDCRDSIRDALHRSTQSEFQKYDASGSRLGGTEGSWPTA